MRPRGTFVSRSARYTEDTPLPPSAAALTSSRAWFELYPEGAEMAPTADVLVERPADGTAVAVFSGEHDLASAPEVTALFDSLLQQDDLIVADFSSAQYVDSSILALVFDTQARARELGKVFRLQLHTADIVRRAFEISGVFAVVEHVTTRDEALMRDDN